MNSLRLRKRKSGKAKVGEQQNGRNSEAACGVAFMVLRATYAIADVFPPLKAVAGAALEIGEIANNFGSNQREWQMFGDYVQEILARVIRLLSKADSSSRILRDSISELVITVGDILSDVRVYQTTSKFRRFVLFSKDPEEIVELRRKLDAAVKVFQIECSISTDLQLSDVLARLQVDNVTRMIEAVNEKLMERLVSTTSLEQLPYVKGASWNPNRVCLKGTREALLSEVMEWSSPRTGSADVFLLLGVAGSGKTAIAHSIAQQMFERGTLVSSFFFNKEDAGLSKPTGLMTTLARDISRLNRSLFSTVASAIESDPALPTAHSLTHQFQKLVIEPLKRCPLQSPLMVVIDALDEGCSEDLLRILRDDVPTIPSPIRFFITSRPTSSILRFLHSKLGHVRHHSINIHSRSNKEDVALYVRHELRAIAQDISLAKRHSTGRDTPDGQSALIADVNAAQLAQKAEGLFVWASTIMSYLGAAVLPENLLLSILLDPSPLVTTTPSRKMDKLYLDILNVFNWADPDFVEGYQLILGTMVVALTPLSIPALQSIHSSSRVNVVRIERAIARLGSLLVIPAEHHSPIHMIHLSLREFITTHASVPMLIDEREHHRRLAPLLFRAMNGRFSQMPRIFGTGYLGNEGIPGIPHISLDVIPEEVWYACRFWPDHLEHLIMDDGGLVPAAGDVCDSEMVEFFRLHLACWMEIVVSLGRYRPLGRVWTCIMTLVQEAEFSQRIMRVLVDMQHRLKEATRTQEESACRVDASFISS
ncbi:hypothetical protein PM082_011306 [Marasmius tenuissimus]|nr:hypothetical protein PM082_011306 [Marasmius tenuissimus]